ncbi:MAG: SDR family oxidoreductase [Oceanipulchritudo sp.]
MNSPFRLDNHRILVTGGGSGLGLGMARAMAAAGASVLIVGRNGDKLKAAADENGPGMEWRVHDVTDLEATPAFIDSVERTFGPLDTLVNNAGIHLKKPATEVNDAEFAAVLQTHLHAAFTLSRECARHMKERRSGHLLFIASMASLFGIPMVSAYSAAKTAQLGLVRSLAVDLGDQGIRVNAIAPGWIHSDMMHRALDSDPARRDKILHRTPLGRFGNAGDVANAAIYLSSPAGSFSTGVCLPVDGGVSIGF